MVVKSDKKAILIIIILLLNVFLIGLTLYFLGPNEPKEPKDIVAELVDFSECQSKSYQQTCYDTKYIDNKTYNIIYDKLKVDNKSKSLVGASLQVNDAVLINEDDLVYHIENHIYFTESTIVLAVYEPKVKNVKVIIFDYKGNKLKEIYILDDESDIVVKSFKVKGDKIIFKGQKNLIDNAVILSTEGDTKFIFENADLCKQIDVLKLKDSDLYSAEYELKYVTDKRFSRIKKRPNTEVYIKEYKDEINCE